jgi:hypothetical protein
VWEPPPLPLRPDKVGEMFKSISIDWDLNGRREGAYASSNKNAAQFWRWLHDPDQVSDDEIEALGLVRLAAPRPWTVDGKPGELRKIEVHSVRPARRVDPEGNLRSALVVEITQTFRPQAMPTVRFRGGCTLVIDLATARVRYMVRKKVANAERFSAQLKFGADASDSLHGNYFDEGALVREPFALMHHVHG